MTDAESEIILSFTYAQRAAFTIYAGAAIDTATRSCSCKVSEIDSSHALLVKSWNLNRGF
jgi:hypothetical protein